MPMPTPSPGNMLDLLICESGTSDDIQSVAWQARCCVSPSKEDDAAKPHTAPIESRPCCFFFLMALDTRDRIHRKARRCGANRFLKMFSPSPSTKVPDLQIDLPLGIDFGQGHSMHISRLFSHLYHLSFKRLALQRPSSTAILHSLCASVAASWSC